MHGQGHVIPPENVGQLFENALGAIRVILYDDAKATLDEQDRADDLIDVSVVWDKACWEVVATYTFSDPTRPPCSNWRRDKRPKVRQAGR